MKKFNFYFETKKVNLNEEKNVIEIELNELGQGILFSPQEFQQTIFQKLILPVTPQVRKALLENDIINKRMVVKDVQNEPTLANIDEKMIKLTAGAFENVEMVNSENENPFDPLKIDWDNLLKKKEGWKSRWMWWNPRDMKFWDPPLTLEEQKSFPAETSADRWKAWEIYKERYNKQNRKLDFYFQANNKDKYHSVSGEWCNEYRDQWKIEIFSWPPFSPPSEIKELIPNGSPRIEEMDNLVIGRIDLVFDNQDAENMKLFHQWDNLLTTASSKQKFVVRNIPLQISQSSYTLDNFRDFHKLDWQNWHKKGDEEPQWEETENADFMRKGIYRGKKIRTIQIGTKGLEKQLKLEKISEEEYNHKTTGISSQEFNNWKEILKKWMKENNIEEIILKGRNQVICKRCNNSGSLSFGGDFVPLSGTSKDEKLPEIPEGSRVKIAGVDMAHFFQKIGKNSITRQELGINEPVKEKETREEEIERLKTEIENLKKLSNRTPQQEKELKEKEARLRWLEDSNNDNPQQKNTTIEKKNFRFLKILKNPFVISGLIFVGFIILLLVLWYVLPKKKKKKNRIRI